MNKITLRTLPLSDLSIKYARFCGDGRVTHYSVPFASIVLGGDPKELVSNFIKKTEPDAELEFLPPAHVDSQRVAAPYVLANDEDIRNALEAKEIKSNLYQYLDLSNLTRTQLVISWIAYHVNPIINFFNRGLNIVQQKFYNVHPIDHFLDTEDETVEQRISREQAISAKLEKFKFLPLVPTFEEQYVRKITPAIYHALAYDEDKEDEAAAILRADLRKYQDLGAIMGHLSMPSTIEVGEFVGTGKRRFILFCFLFIDMYKVPGFNPLVPPKFVHTPVDGIVSAAWEGCYVSLPELTTEFQVETINVAESYDDNLAAYHDSYRASLPVVDKAVKNTQKKIDAAKKAQV